MRPPPAVARRSLAAQDVLPVALQGSSAQGSGLAPLHVHVDVLLRCVHHHVVHLHARSVSFVRDLLAVQVVGHELQDEGREAEAWLRPVRGEGQPSHADLALVTQDEDKPRVGEHRRELILHGEGESLAHGHHRDNSLGQVVGGIAGLLLQPVGELGEDGVGDLLVDVPCRAVRLAGVGRGRGRGWRHHVEPSPRTGRDDARKVALPLLQAVPSGQWSRPVDATALEDLEGPRLPEEYCPEDDGEHAGAHRGGRRHQGHASGGQLGQRARGLEGRGEGP
mmetsp:Transcript_47980/g.128393  ORF Transcript_47980/g.128393 Transcript_47980/m.128393 type:complete len:279 (+) Transcript_47980:153-989(+)